jgi:hypothetical protein
MDLWKVMLEDLKYNETFGLMNEVMKNVRCESVGRVILVDM